MSDCLFCSIVAGDVPAEIVADNDGAIAFTDINPQAPTHVLVIPRRHEPDLGSLAQADTEASMALLNLIKQVGDDSGGAYRTVFNTGADVGQTVFHAHAHVLAGRDLSWPPG